MNIEHLLERYLEKKGINSEKIPEDKFNLVVGRIEDDFDTFIEDRFDEIASEWVFLEIEQELEEHPEWKLQKLKGAKK